jgi:hypothetical protein
MTFTILVKTVTYPLNYKQMASTMAMQRISVKSLLYTIALDICATAAPRARFRFCN